MQQYCDGFGDGFLNWMQVSHEFATFSTISSMWLFIRFALGRILRILSFQTCPNCVWIFFTCLYLFQRKLYLHSNWPLLEKHKSTLFKCCSVIILLRRSKTCFPSPSLNFVSLGKNFMLLMALSVKFDLWLTNHCLPVIVFVHTVSITADFEASNTNISSFEIFSVNRIICILLPCNLYLQQHWHYFDHFYVGIYKPSVTLNGILTVGNFTVLIQWIYFVFISFWFVYSMSFMFFVKKCRFLFNLYSISCILHWCWW